VSEVTAGHEIRIGGRRGDRYLLHSVRVDEGDGAGSSKIVTLWEAFLLRFWEALLPSGGCWKSSHPLARRHFPGKSETTSM
jgi:hypothetical protein